MDELERFFDLGEESNTHFDNFKSANDFYHGSFLNTT